MRYQIREKPSDPEDPERPLTLNIVDYDGNIVAEGHLVADYAGAGEPESLLICGVVFEGIHKAATS